MKQHNSLLDTLIIQFDGLIRTLYGSDKPHHVKETTLPPKEAHHIACLMRINHTGEVCAQALYQGQGLTAKLTETRHSMEKAALEEEAHLAWCEARIKELDGHVSLLNPLWYMGSYLLGAIAGLAGDEISLGFVAETERQVSAHLKHHLQQIPDQDKKTRAILEQMLIDESNHALTAEKAGAASLPFVIKKSMQFMAKCMTTLTYYV